MATVILSRTLQRFTAGVDRVEVRAASVRDLVRALDSLFPGIGAEIDGGMAIAIDGEIIADPLLESVPPEAEVHFLPAIRGG